MSGLVTDAVLMQRRRRSLRAQRSACGADDFHMGRFPAVRMGRLARFSFDRSVSKEQTLPRPASKTPGLLLEMLFRRDWGGFHFCWGVL